MLLVRRGGGTQYVTVNPAGELSAGRGRSVRAAGARTVLCDNAELTPGQAAIPAAVAARTAAESPCSTIQCGSSAISRSSPTSTTASRRWPIASSRSAAACRTREMEAQVLDSNPIERERGITIKAQSVSLPYTAQGRQDLPAQLHRHPGPRRLLLRSQPLAGRLRRRAAGGRCGAGRRGAVGRQLLHRGGAGPGSGAGAQQDRPADRRHRQGQGRDRGRDRHRRRGRGGDQRQDRPQRASTCWKRSSSASRRRSRATPTSCRR